MFDWLKVKTSLADARTECNNLRSTIATNKLRIEELKSLPPPREEVAELLTRRMDEVAGRYPQKLAASVKMIIQNPCQNVGGIREANYGGFCRSEVGGARVLTASLYDHNDPTPYTVEAALFCLLGDQLKASVRKVVQEMEYPAIVGPAMPKRLAEIDKLTKENVGLEAKLKEMELEFAAISVDAVN